MEYENSFPMPLPGAGADTLMWARPWEVEPAALQQLRNVSKLPWTEKVRVMPDVHLGKGATVGSVIAMRDAVSPNAVGVDIGCLDTETEFLSPSGWISIADWNGEDVLVYEPRTDSVWFSRPHAYIDQPCDEFWHFKNSKGMDQMLSDEHRMLVFYGLKNKGYKHAVLQPYQTAQLKLAKGYYCTKAAFHSTMPDLPISDEMIRIEIMIQADGRIRPNSKTNQVELHFRRERKIKRAKELLEAAEIDYKSSIAVDGSTWIWFKLQPHEGSKDLTQFYLASHRQLEIITDEVLHWDGHDSYRSNFSSTDKRAVDLVQFAFAATGTRTGISNVGKQAAHHNDVFMANPTRNEMVGYCSPVKAPSVDGRKYCFVVETGFFVARRNGKIFTTGNCGMACIATDLTVSDLPDSLRRIRSDMEAAVPVGFHAHDGAARLPRTSPLAAQRDRLFSRFAELRADRIADREAKMIAQCGSLGGGNHFIELMADESGVLHLMLHSGSRNIGKELAERHIAKAKDLEHNLGLPDRDLAVFLSGTDEMAAYLHDLHWAQEYARINREAMLALVCDVLRAHFPQVGFGAVINCHHNYVATETYDGVELIVTRKGAIRAGSGEMGLIPGSMGTGSFIVRGLGNQDGLCSASHGAGRRMSRSRAKKEYTLEDLIAQTSGVECRKDAGVLDEIPGSYKDLQSVIDAQTTGPSPLIQVVSRLRTLLCVKG